MANLDFLRKKKKKSTKETEGNTEEKNGDNTAGATQEQPEEPAFDPSTVNMDDYKNHVALTGIKKGSCGQILGKVTIVAFLINEFKSAWDDAAVEAFKRILIRAAETLQNESGLTKNELSVSYAFDLVPVQRKYIRGESHDIVHDVLPQYGYDTVASYQEHYQKKFDKDVAPILFVFNRDFRSYAYHYSGQEAVEAKTASEYSFISYGGDETDDLRVVLHEMLHQFGCIDYYYPEAIKTAANTFFQDSIMGGGTVFDDLTKYVVGWLKEPTKSMVEFLEATKDVTENDIDEGRKEQDKYDW